MRNFHTVALVTLVLLAAPRTGAADKAPLAYWPLDEGQGNVSRDASGHGHDLQLSGTSWEKGAVGSCLRLHGAKSTASTPLTSDLLPSHVTVAAWVKVERLPDNSEGIGIVNAQSSYLLRITSGNGAAPSFHVYTDHWEPVISQDTIMPGQWYHLVGTYDGQEQRLYVNGELVAVRKRTGQMNKPSGALLIGRQADPLEGCVDEVAIYGRALSAAEVGELYHEALKKLNPGIIPGQLVEPFEDLFGKTRGNPAPLPTLQHLPPADLTFVVITDTHIGEPTDEGMFCHNWRVEEAIRQINALRPDFVVLCGDIITTFPFRREQFERQCQNAVSILKKFTCPVRLVPGNHDIGNQRNMRVWDDKWLQQRQVTLEEMLFNPDYRALYIKYFGPDYYSFDAEGCQFIVFNAEICNSGGQLEQKQMQWLEQELKRAQGARASFLFMHNPLFWAEPEEPGPRNYEPVLQPARQQVLSLLERYPVTAVYSGHTHFGFENEYRGTHMRTINSTTFNRNYASIEQMMPFAAQIYDPHKLGYLVVRVRGAEVHESWTPLYWRVEALPGQLGQSGGRLVPRPASELADSVLGIRAQPPTTRLEQRSGQMAERMTDNELWWRLGENIGAKWVQTWPMPVSEADWQRMARGLSMDHPRGVTIALPMPAEANAMRETWQKLSQWAGGVDALIVCNGGPSDPKAPLSSWQVSGTPSEWANACRVARQLIGPAKKVVLARLSLLGPEAAELLKQTVAAARGAADAVAVWVTTQGPIESTVLPALQQAARTAREAEMELWLDTASWQTVSEPTRSANFLRLLAYCQMLGVRVFWWIGPDARGGLIDNHLDPTQLYYAAAAWIAAAAMPDTQPHLAERDWGWEARWKGADGHAYIAWWRPDDNVNEIGRAPLKLPETSLVFDPLHCQILKLPAREAPPLCAWPLVARLP